MALLYLMALEMNTRVLKKPPLPSYHLNSVGNSPCNTPLPHMALELESDLYPLGTWNTSVGITPSNAPLPHGT